MAKKIMIDAGHYGKYNKGVISGYYESDMTWELHNYLKTELESYGFEVGVTRTDKNKDLEVSQRGLKSKGYDLFLSLHSNAASGQSADYVALYHLAKDNTTKVDEVSKAVAEKLAPVVASVMGTKQKYQVLTRSVDFDRDKDGYLNDNYYGVLHGADLANTAGIIIEHSFHTNPTACKWLMNSSNLKKLAVAEAKVLADYYGMKKQTTNTSTNTSTTNTNKTKYYVQSGAYSTKSDAEKQIAKLKKAGFNAYLVKAGGMYKVRVGAYYDKTYANAMLTKVKAAGFAAFITSQGGTTVVTSSSVNNELKVGDKVKLKSNAYVYGTKTKFASFVYNSTLYIRQINGDKVVISTQKTGAVTGTVTKNDLIKI